MDIVLIDKVAKILAKGGLAVFATDTIYAMHTPAFNKQAVERVYQLKGRNETKPFIILIHSIKELERFDIRLTPQLLEFLHKHWPAKLSVILPCTSPKFHYLHRGTNTLAFRFPDKNHVLELLAQTGPLISTSVNPSGLVAASTIAEAKRYFGDNIDSYIDEGPIDSLPSAVVKVDNDNNIEIIRQGEVKI